MKATCTVIEYKHQRVKIRLNTMSLIGTGTKRPTSWGNYFSLSLEEANNAWLPGVYVLNFWWENLEAADKRFSLGGEVDILLITVTYDVQVKRQWCIIYDTRIPEDWYHNELCFTGGGRPPVEVAEYLYDLLGDPTNQLEQFTDPKSYYLKRGGDYDEKTGIIRYTVTAAPRKLENWTIEPMQELRTYCGPELVQDLTKLLSSNKETNE